LHLHNVQNNHRGSALDGVVAGGNTTKKAFFASRLGKHSRGSQSNMSSSGQIVPVKKNFEYGFTSPAARDAPP
jgi:hypothetical protein